MECLGARLARAFSCARGCRRAGLLTPYRGWGQRGEVVVWFRRVYSVRYTVKTRWEGAREETPKTFALK